MTVLDVRMSVFHVRQFQSLVYRDTKERRKISVLAKGTVIWCSLVKAPLVA